MKLTNEMLIGMTIIEKDAYYVLCEDENNGNIYEIDIDDGVIMTVYLLDEDREVVDEITDEWFEAFED